MSRDRRRRPGRPISDSLVVPIALIALLLLASFVLHHCYPVQP